MTIQKFNHFAETKNRTIIQIKLNLPKFKFGPLTKFEPICQKKNMTYIRDVRGPVRSLRHRFIAFSARWRWVALSDREL